jgi:hypothetical protein
MLKKLTRTRLMIEDGDRRHATHSGGVIGEIASLLVRNQDIMSKLVLGDDLLNSTGSGRLQDRGESCLAAYLGLERCPIFWREPGVVEDRYNVHAGSLLMSVCRQQQNFMPDA